MRRTYGTIRSVFPWSIIEIVNPSDEYLCELCEERPATIEGIEYLRTMETPEERLGVCDECGGGTK